MIYFQNLLNVSYVSNTKSAIVTTAYEYESILIPLHVISWSEQEVSRANAFEIFSIVDYRYILVKSKTTRR